LECVEIVGRSLLERMVDRFIAVEADPISILLLGGDVAPFRTARTNVTIEKVSDLSTAVRAKLSSFARRGIQHSFVSWASAYVETDLLDLFCFHRESRQSVTPTFNENGPLPLWVVDCSSKVSQSEACGFQETGQLSKSKYFVREYVNRVTAAQHLRTFAADILNRRCETDPAGKQVRPGVWMDDGADVHRRARIVAPAYIGCQATVQADALITRLSHVERNCRVEYGTVVEDSSILENTTVGICLDVCHSVASGTRILSLERGVVVEITDPRVMRYSAPPRNNSLRASQGLPQAVDVTATQLLPAFQFENI
jgi:hypothetical protein